MRNNEMRLLTIVVTLVLLGRMAGSAHDEEAKAAGAVADKQA